MSSIARVLDLDGLDELVGALRARGFRVLGPRLRDGAIVYGELGSARDLPAGWTDVQEPGSYRLERRRDDAVFGYAVGPHSWKRTLLPPSLRLFRTGPELDVEEEPLDTTPTALLGVRPCELAAIAVQDRVFLGGRHADRDYAARRSSLFVVAVNCGDPASTCFCTSMRTGPEAGAGYDLVLTEVLAGGHRFLVESGSAAGSELLEELPAREAEDADRAAARAVIRGAAAAMEDGFDPAEARVALLESLEHPRWEEIAERCLSCGNCTLACPTCFCTSVEDVTDLDGNAERVRVWDTCFSVGYSEMHGGATRQSSAARYRQWLTHKLATWHDQFGTAGCVGCGRCITWCPAGIDLREEARAFTAASKEEAEHANA